MDPGTDELMAPRPGPLGTSALLHTTVTVERHSQLARKSHSPQLSSVSFTQAVLTDLQNQRQTHRQGRVFHILTARRVVTDGGTSFSQAPLSQVYTASRYPPGIRFLALCTYGHGGELRLSVT